MKQKCLLPFPDPTAGAQRPRPEPSAVADASDGGPVPCRSVRHHVAGLLRSDPASHLSTHAPTPRS